MNPTAEFFGSIIDCRRLFLQGRYFWLAEEEVLSLAEMLYDFINESFGDISVLDWKVKNRSIRNMEDLKKVVIPQDEVFQISFLGDITSRIVYNKKSLKAYDQKMRWDPVYEMSARPTFASVDYPDYVVNEIEPYKDSAERYRQALIRLFCKEGKVYKDLCRQHDISGTITNSSMLPRDKLQSGVIQLSISCYCLGNELDATAEKLLDFAIAISKAFSNINLAVTIGEGYADYIRYFPFSSSIKWSKPVKEINGIERSKYTAEMSIRAKYFYLQSVGWANIVSSKVARFPSPHFLSAAGAESVICYEYIQDSICIRLNYGISEMMIEDLKKIKEALYPWLIPGRMVVKGWDWSFRSYWENVPVLDEELQVYPNEVILGYNGELDVDYLMNMVSG